MAQVFGLLVFMMFYLEYVYFFHKASKDQTMFFNNEQLRCIIKILYEVLFHIEIFYVFWHIWFLL